jgi:hypothetical protein
MTIHVETVYIQYAVSRILYTVSSRVMSPFSFKTKITFNTEWNILGSSQYEIEHFPLPFENVSSLNLDHYKLFLSSDHVNFLGKNGACNHVNRYRYCIYAKQKIQMDIVWLNCMKKECIYVFMILLVWLIYLWHFTITICDSWFHGVIFI